MVTSRPPGGGEGWPEAIMGVTRGLYKCALATKSEHKNSVSPNPLLRQNLGRGWVLSGS